MRRRVVDVDMRDSHEPGTPATTSAYPDRPPSDYRRWQGWVLLVGALLPAIGWSLDVAPWLIRAGNGPGDAVFFLVIGWLPPVGMLIGPYLLHWATIRDGSMTSVVTAALLSAPGVWMVTAVILGDEAFSWILWMFLPIFQWPLFVVALIVWVATGRGRGPSGR